MRNEQIKAKVKTILSLPSGSDRRGVIGRDTAQAMLDVIEALEAERDSYRASFNNQRIRADLAVAQCEDIRATISGPSKEIENLRLRIESLMGRVDAVESTAPTPFAYNAACKALDKHRARADAAEAEIARRDAAAGEAVAGEAVAWEITTKPGEFSLTPDKSTAIRAITNGCCVRELYTAVPPAVLPHKLSMDIDPELQGEFRVHEAIRRKGFNQALDAALELGAQPQKPVVLPALFNLKMAGDVKTKQYFKGINDTIKQIAGLLDAANVPHTGGK